MPWRQALWISSATVDIEAATESCSRQKTVVVLATASNAVGWSPGRPVAFLPARMTQAWNRGSRNAAEVQQGRNHGTPILARPILRDVHRLKCGRLAGAMGAQDRGLCDIGCSRLGAGMACTAVSPWPRCTVVPDGTGLALCSFRSRQPRGICVCSSVRVGGSVIHLARFSIIASGSAA